MNTKEEKKRTDTIVSDGKGNKKRIQEQHSNEDGAHNNTRRIESILNEIGSI